MLYTVLYIGELIRINPELILALCIKIEVIHMGVPESIRSIERPTNTVVTDTGGNGMYRYAVRKRESTRYVPGGNPQPQNGSVIGHIIDNKYVPLREKVAIHGADMLSYGSSALIHSVSSNLLSDLMEVFDARDAYKIMAIASLRVIRKSVPDRRLHTQYRKTYISRYYPGVSLSAAVVSQFQYNLGRDNEKRLAFYRQMMDKVEKEHHIVVDGTLKQDTSIANDLSRFSRKARVKDCRDISVLYAYDLEKMEPVCAEVFPGNEIDSVAFPAFVKDNDICRGILISDKGFPIRKIETLLADRPDLHYLSPLKRNDARISDNGMLHNWDGVLPGTGRRIYYKKRQIKGGRYLYSFKDAFIAGREDCGYNAKSVRKEDFDAADYEDKSDRFGTIVLESDADLLPPTVFTSYADRWQVELVFKQYKSDTGLTDTRVQGDFSVRGSEFINFIATVITCRIIGKTKAAGLLEDATTIEDILEDLSEVWRKTDAPEDKEPMIGDGYWVNCLETYSGYLEKLDLAKPYPEAKKPKRGPGRPRKNPLPDNANPKPKRRPGRPGKNPEAATVPTEKRKRGRPSRNPVSVQAVQPTVKCKRGRPRKNPVDTDSNNGT